MEQSRLESLIESIVNQVLGIITAFLTWRYIAMPYLMYMGYVSEVIPFWVNMFVTLIFTVVSVIRSYGVRRFFNAGLHWVVHKAVTRFYKWRMN